MKDLLNSSVSIKKITDKKGMNAFINFAYDLYRNDIHWVPPLRIERQEFFNPKKNPYFSHAKVEYFLAMRGDRVVGRVTAHEDEIWNTHYKTRQGFFGFYESEDDSEVAAALMQAVEDWCKIRGIANVIGPMDFNTNHEIGFLTEGFDSSPVLLLKYTKPYYPQLLVNLRYSQVRTLLGYTFPAQDPLSEKYNKMADRAKKFAGDSFKIRNIEKKRLREELDPILEIYNEAWSENWGFIPMTAGEIDLLAEQFRLFMDPKFIYILEKEERIVGFFLCLPDINQALGEIRNGRLFPLNIIKFLWNFRKIDRASIILLGVKKEFRNKGLELILMRRGLLDASKPPIKYRTIGTTWILDTNKPMNAIMEFLNGKITKRYAVVAKDI